MGPPWPYALIVEDPLDHPEWITLAHVGSGTPGFLVVEMNMSTGEIRSSGPTVVGKQPPTHRYPIAPAP